MAQEQSKVYVVTSFQVEDDWRNVHGTFRSRTRAEACAKEIVDEAMDDYDEDEVGLDISQKDRWILGDILQVDLYEMPLQD